MLRDPAPSRILNRDDTTMKHWILAAALIAATSNARCAEPTAAPPADAPCPAAIPAGTHCMTGRDEAGAYYWIAVPQPWNHVLVLHAHGGPELGPPRAERTAQDLTRWAVMVKAGYAWAGSTYRQAASQYARRAKIPSGCAASRSPRSASPS